jgi:hypothetical protein
LSPLEEPHATDASTTTAEADRARVPIVYVVHRPVAAHKSDGDYVVVGAYAMR